MKVIMYDIENEQDIHDCYQSVIDAMKKGLKRGKDEYICFKFQDKDVTISRNIKSYTAWIGRA